MKKHNFSAGPSILPENVIKQAAQTVIELDDIGLSILEISHRSNYFLDIITEAQNLIKELLGISDDYEILFLQGGASLQFHMSAFNFSVKGGLNGYIDTGTWSNKAIKESEKIGFHPHNWDVKSITIASSKDKNYNYIPKNIDLETSVYNYNEKNHDTRTLNYLHFTSNNTIYGTQFHSFTNILKQLKNTKLICDMSSDILSKKIDVNNFDLIYAGAQKNLGPAGCTLVIIKKSSLTSRIDIEKLNHNSPTYLNYNTHIEKKSMFNTPPVFSIYVVLLTLRWIKANGGVKKIEKNNNLKAKKLYDEIDRNKLFEGFAEKEDRSIMNATFNLKEGKLKNVFEKMCNEEKISGIQGHRLLGGYRASMYNAMNIDSINVLVDIMRNIENK